MLNWSRQQLAEQAGTGARTIARIEDEDVDEPRPATVDGIRAALEKAGVEFIAENGGGAGVRLKKRRH